MPRLPQIAGLISGGFAWSMIAEGRWPMPLDTGLYGRYQPHGFLYNLAFGGYLFAAYVLGFGLTAWLQYQLKRPTEPPARAASTNSSTTSDSAYQTGPNADQNLAAHLKSTITVQGLTLDAARAAAATEIDKLTMAERETIEEQILFAGSIDPTSNRYKADTVEAAFAKEVRARPPGKEKLNGRVLAEAKEDTIEVTANSRAQVFANVEGRAKDGWAVAAVICKLPPRTGLFGLGQRAGRYEVRLFQEAVVEVQRCTPAKLQVSWIAGGRRHGDAPNVGADA